MEQEFFEAEFAFADLPSAIKKNEAEMNELEPKEVMANELVPNEVKPNGSAQNELGADANGVANLIAKQRYDYWRLEPVFEQAKISAKQAWQIRAFTLAKHDILGVDLAFLGATNSSVKDVKATSKEVVNKGTVIKDAASKAAMEEVAKIAATAATKVATKAVTKATTKAATKAAAPSSTIKLASKKGGFFELTYLKEAARLNCVYRSNLAQTNNANSKKEPGFSYAFSLDFAAESQQAALQQITTLDESQADSQAESQTDFQGDFQEQTATIARNLALDLDLIVKMPLSQTAYVYGLGDQMAPLNKRGYKYQLWNTDDPHEQLEQRASLYKSLPIFYVLEPVDGACLAVFADNSSRAQFAIDNEQNSLLTYRVRATQTRLYCAVGKTFKEAVQKILGLLGVNRAPRRDLLGYHQSRWSYKSAKEVTALAEKFAKLKLPLSTIHLDIDYMEGFRDFTWDKERFAEPNRLAETLQAQGIGLIPILDAGIKFDPDYEVYQTGKAQHLFLPALNMGLKLAGGNASISDNEAANNPKHPMQLPQDTYVGWVWPGHTVYPDFEKAATRSWWAKQVKAFAEKTPLQGIWLDMNEPANFNGDLPDALVSGASNLPLNERAHLHWHNRYANQMTLATYTGLLAAKKVRPFVFSRAAYAGIQRFGAVWTGDSKSVWGQLRMQVSQMLSLNLAGLTMNGGDIGGFAADPTPELFVRWCELGLFMPLMRNHAELLARRQEPWSFDQKTLDLTRTLLNWRYRLLPYIYDQLVHCEKTKQPFWRPLAYLWPDDKETYHLYDQFMWGENCLVAPVVDPGYTKRAVYLPKGTWYDFWRGDDYDCSASGRYVLVEAALGQPPLFVKAGTVIPTWPRPKEPCSAKIRNYTGVPAELELFVFADSEINSPKTYRHYVDAGLDLAYLEANKCTYYEWQVNKENVETVTHRGENGNLYDKIRLTWYKHTKNNCKD